MPNTRNSRPRLVILIGGMLLLSLACGGDQPTDPGSDNGSVTKELQIIRAHFEVTVEERINEWMITGPAAGVDISFYPQKNGDNITLGRAAQTTDNNGKILYICVAGSLYVGETFTLTLAAIRTGCNTDGWVCSEQGNSPPETFTVIQGESDYYHQPSTFATPE